MINVRRARVAGFIGAASLVALAPAQTGGTYILSIQGLPTPSQPIVMLDVWAIWDDPGGAFVFGGGNYDLTASEGEFLSAINILNGPASTVGAIAGNKITGASNGQLHIPVLGYYGSRDNPILLASYEWKTTNYSPRLITFETSNTNNFIVAAESTGLTTQLYPHEFRPGTAMILPPSPSTLTQFVLGGLIVARRRR